MRLEYLLSGGGFRRVSSLSGYIGHIVRVNLKERSIDGRSEAKWRHEAEADEDVL